MKNKACCPVEEKSAIGFISLSVNIFFDIDEEQDELQFNKRVFFNPSAWENEIIWQAVQMIREHHNDKKVAIETLDKILEELKKD